MLIPPRKKTFGVDYQGRMGKFFSIHYSAQEANEMKEAIKNLSELRAQSLHASEATNANCDVSIRYWAQLCLLDKRIDFSQIGLVFTWIDAFKGPTTLSPNQGRMNSTALTLEISSVLFNIGAMLAFQGNTIHSSGGQENLKQASILFKRAAGFFAGVKAYSSRIDGAVSIDLVRTWHHGGMG
eukprot:763020-Hanusia_phi.AAC.12